MKDSLAQRRNDDKGFTLIELMVVVLIIAILLAIAIPTFLGAQNKAKDRSAQSSARNALTNAKTLYADAGTYIDANFTALGTSEPSLTFLDAPASSTGAKVVSVLSTGAMTWYAAVLSDTKTCYYIRDSVDTAVSPRGTTYAKVGGSSSTTCIATGTLPTTVPATVFAVDGWK
jgi:type IV pilus assembly protein PilA